MATKKSIPIASAEPVKCEDCRNYTGYFLTFGCSKDHQPDYEYGQYRKDCADLAPLTRKEQIFKRFKGIWDSDVELKKKKATVARTATTLRNALSEFEKVLTSDQITAIRSAATALDGLESDIELAGRLAKKHKEDELVRMALEKQVSLDKLAATYFGVADDAKVIAIAETLDVFASGQGVEWLQHHTSGRRRFMPVSLSKPFEKKIKIYRSHPTPVLMTEIKRMCAECFEVMGLGTKWDTSPDVRMTEFEAFLIWRTEQNDLMRRIAAGDIGKTN